MVEASSNEDLAAVEQPQDGDDVEDDNVDVVMDHFMAMLGATILIALLTIPAMGASARQPADVWNQHSCPDYTLGDRLPIVQGGSFAYLSATFSIINNPSLTDIQD